jgi:hypothetical protein
MTQEEYTLETSSGSKEYKAIEAGLYIAQVDNVELIDAAVWDETKGAFDDSETVKKWNFKFRLAKPAMSDKPIKDIDGDECPTGARCAWKKLNKNPRYAFKGKIELTNFGHALTAVGVDPKADSFKPADVEGKYVIIKLSVKDGFKDKTKKSNVVDDIMPFDGDVDAVSKLMADAKAAYEDAANAQVVVEDVDFESA